MKTAQLKSLRVQADPLLAKRHPLHDNRYITTTDAKFETWRSSDAEGHGDDCCGFVDNQGSIIAVMRDCENQAQYAKLFAASVEMKRALEQILLYASVNHTKLTDYSETALAALNLL